MAQTSIITGQNVKIQQTAATVLQRLIAWIIDYFVLFLASIFFGLIIAALISDLNNEDLQVAFVVASFLALSLYPFWMEQFNNGQSVGKMVMKIRVVCLDGTRPSISALFIRWLTLTIDIFLGLAFIIFSKNSQRIGDLAAGTTVVKNPKGKRPEILNAILFISKDYQPSFPEASKLTMHQVGIIEKVLDLKSGEERTRYINQLTDKITEMLGIKPKDNNYENFLVTLYNDFQFYATKVV
ncbi:MAG: RDD family protein [Prevotella sp.]|nr:RDD family protein [Prevotella sp.]